MKIVDGSFVTESYCDRYRRKIRNISSLYDCTVHLAWTNRLKTFYFWMAVKDIRWPKLPGFPLGRVEVNTYM